MVEGNGLNRKYLHVQDLRRLRNLFFSSRRCVEGQYAGRHASPARGHSVEFNDYRQYTPGDEVGDIDWKVYGRSDKLFVKLFEHQSDMTVSLLVDGSASMAYAGGDGVPRRDASRSGAPDGRAGVSKYDHACRMAAAIAFLTTKQTDRIAFGLSQEGLSSFHRPYGSFGHLVGILKAMEEARPRGEAKLGESIRKMASLVAQRGLLVVFSDLLDDPEGIFSALSIFTHRGSEVIIFHVLHADELRLPNLAEAVFQDSESGRKVGVNVADVRPAYERRLQHFLEVWSAGCKGRGMDYNLVSTATHYRQSLEQYLFQRASMV